MHVPEHPDLVHNVIPVSGRLELFGQQAVQLLAHVDDASGHGPDVALPLLEQLVVVQDERHLITNATQTNIYQRNAPEMDSTSFGVGDRLTRRAPWAGGLLISDRAKTDSWLLIRTAASFEWDTTCSAPTRSPYRPAFFAKLCARGRPSA